MGYESLKSLCLPVLQQAIRFAFPRQIYNFSTQTAQPASRRFGYDRGTPIDRYWTDKWITANKGQIHGVCLEIGDNRYTMQYGNKISRTDVLDVNGSNTKATIVSSLTDCQQTINDQTYDCIILTHVLGLIDQPEKAISECYRILKPGGTLLITSACLAPQLDNNEGYWRFTPKGIHYLLSKSFKPENITVKSYGNAQAGALFFMGYSQQDLTDQELTVNDPQFPCIAGAVATK